MANKVGKVRRGTMENNRTQKETLVLKKSNVAEEDNILKCEIGGTRLCRAQGKTSFRRGAPSTARQRLALPNLAVTKSSPGIPVAL